jgi:hypothetical protein
LVSIILGEGGFADVTAEDFVSEGWTQIRQVKWFLSIAKVVQSPRFHFFIFNMNQIVAKNKLVDSVSKLCGES